MGSPLRGEGGRILASPRARAAARDAGVDLSSVRGTGPNGRIVADDIVAFDEVRQAAAPADGATSTTDVAEDISTAAREPAQTASAGASTPRDMAVHGAPATGGGRMLAELLGIDLREIPPASPGARVTRDDVAAWVRARLSENGAIASAVVPDPPADHVQLLQKPT